MLALLHQLHVFRWPLVPCTVLVWDCICVCARTGPWLPNPRAPPTLNRTVCVYLLRIPLVLRSVYARCCGVSLGHHYFFCVYRYEHDKLKTFRWRTPNTHTHTSPQPHPSVLQPTFLHCFLLHCALAARTNMEAEDRTGRWNLWCPNDNLIRSINTPVGCVCRWLWWRN